LKRTRRFSIEIEHREITLYTAAAHPSAAFTCPGDPISFPSAAALLGHSTASLAAALTDGSVHFHRLPDGQLVLCTLPPPPPPPRPADA
jgi:hypothetical protein